MDGTETTTVAAGGGGLFLIIWLAVLVFCVVVGWKIFTKAGKPGWASLIPIYNIYVLLQIVGKPGWWLILFFIPVANLVAAIIISISLAQSFGKGGGFAAGLILLPIVFYPILAFGSATYSPVAAPAPAAG
jgi:hypothetical protein